MRRFRWWRWALRRVFGAHTWIADGPRMKGYIVAYADDLKIDPADWRKES